MTDPTPYTDGDVRRLVALIDEGQYHDSAIHPGSMARRLLAAGVTLPPEPDTPPEPQERYYVGDGQYDNKVYERGRAHVYAETYLTLDADRIARLLNLDESVKDDVCSGLHEAYPALVEQLADQAEQIERLIGRRDELAKALTKARRDHRHAQSEARSEVGRLTAELADARERADAFQAMFEEQCQQGDDMFISHYKAIKRAVTAEAELERLQDKASVRAVKAAELALEDARAELIREREARGLERDLFAARVKELETERLGATTDQPVTAEMVYEAIEATGVRDGLDRGDGPMYVRPCDWTKAEAAAVADALNRLLADSVVAWAPPEAER